MMRLFRTKSVKHVIAFVLPALATFAHADVETFQARLAPLPVTVQNVDVITGSGQVIAVLRDGELQIEASFGGLQAPATEAHLHLAPPALPGPAIAALEISKARQGSVRGRLRLDEAQLRALRRNGIYLQIHSEAAPEGNLRGWLFPVTNP